ncbi:hypothetical protein Tco_0716665 [Tanacetum coccineum]
MQASTKHFPFTKEGLRDFKHYALKRRADALKLRTAKLERKTVVVDGMVDALKQKMNEEMRLRGLLAQGSAIESLDEVLSEDEIDALQQSVYALDREADAFGCRADALRRRADILKWRAKACKASINFFEQRKDGCFFFVNQKAVSDELNGLKSGEPNGGSHTTRGGHGNRHDDRNKIELVSMHVYDKALIWHQQFCKRFGEDYPLNIYERETVRRFGSVFDDPLMELKKLKQDGIVKRLSREV